MERLHIFDAGVSRIQYDDIIYMDKPLVDKALTLLEVMDVPNLYQLMSSYEKTIKKHAIYTTIPTDLFMLTLHYEFRENDNSLIKLNYCGYTTLLMEHKASTLHKTLASFVALMVDLDAFNVHPLITTKEEKQIIFNKLYNSVKPPLIGKDRARHGIMPTEVPLQKKDIDDALTVPSNLGIRCTHCRKRLEKPYIKQQLLHLQTNIMQDILKNQYTSISCQHCNKPIHVLFSLDIKYIDHAR